MANIGPHAAFCMKQFYVGVLPGKDKLRPRGITKVSTLATKQLFLPLFRSNLSRHSREDQEIKKKSPEFLPGSVLACTLPQVRAKLLLCDRESLTLPNR